MEQTGQITAPNKTTAYRLSRALSAALHPWITVSCLIAIILFGDTLMIALHGTARLFFLGIVLIDTLFLPAATMLLFRRFGIMSPLGVATKRDRLLSILITGLCYLVALLIVKNILMAFVVYYLLCAAITGCLVTFIISCFWKISLHMTAMGAAVATLLAFSLSGIGNTMIFAMSALLLSGALGSARLYLKAESPAQVGIGFVCGFAIMYLSLRFFI